MTVDELITKRSLKQVARGRWRVELGQRRAEVFMDPAGAGSVRLVSHQRRTNRWVKLWEEDFGHPAGIYDCVGRLTSSWAVPFLASEVQHEHATRFHVHHGLYYLFDDFLYSELKVDAEVAFVVRVSGFSRRNNGVLGTCIMLKADGHYHPLRRLGNGNPEFALSPRFLGTSQQSRCIARNFVLSRADEEAMLNEVKCMK